MTDPDIHYYYREGCHLCEEMAARLFREWPEVAETMQWRDVDSRADWAAEFGSKVPVLMHGRVTLSEYMLDSGRLEAHFGKSPNPV
jgi:hypothetical protein